jgi:hypothetical protein
MSVSEGAVVVGMQALEKFHVQTLRFRIPDARHLWRELCGRVK